MANILKLGPGAIIGLIVGVFLAEWISFGDPAYRASPGYLAAVLVAALLVTALYGFVLIPLVARLRGASAEEGDPGETPD